jgi:RND family efflux transporter MFP subunit
VAKTPIPVVRELPGTVRPRDHAIVGARVMGLVTRADFTVGQPVREGDVIVELAAAEIDARVEQARTALEQSRLDHEREAALLERGASTRERVREMDERRRIAESAFAEAQTLQGYTHVAAPFGGRITRRYVNSGDLATPGAPLFGMEDSSVLRVECEVPESLPELPLGAEVAVRLESETVQTRVVESYPAADPLSRTRRVKLELAPESGARSGQFARVLWPDATIEGVAVPREALSRFGQMERVFVVSSGRAQLRLVRTGMDAGRLCPDHLRPLGQGGRGPGPAGQPA